MYLHRVITPDGTVMEWAYCVTGVHACKLAEARHGRAFIKVYAVAYDDTLTSHRERFASALR